MSEEEKIESGQEENQNAEGETPNAESIDNAAPQYVNVESSIVNKKPLTINNEPITNMEVHHPHHVTHKKKWGEYLLEFFMLFLAVFLGFIAENIREHITESKNEKEYISSLMHDLKDDNSIIKEHQKFFAKGMVWLDSLITLCDAPIITSNTNDLYYYARLATKTDFFYANTRTYEQLKSTGGFRLIKKKSIADAIIAYYAITDQIKELQVSGDDVESNEFRKVAVQVFNADVFNQINSASLNTVLRPTNEPALRTTDKKLLGDLAGWAHYIKNTRIGIAQYENKMNEQGEKLILQIQKEYNLENE